MKFKLTDRKVIPLKLRPDWKQLEDELLDYADSINTTWRGLRYNQRVFYHVSEPIMNPESVRVCASFRSDHVRQDPQKWGDNFRRDCVTEVVLKANDLLQENRTKLLVIVREDYEEIEQQLYERNKA